MAELKMRAYAQKDKKKFRSDVLVGHMNEKIRKKSRSDEMVGYMNKKI